MNKGGQSCSQSSTRKDPTWHRMQTLWMRSILWTHHNVLWYKLECNLIRVHKQARLSPEPIFTKRSNSQERCVQISDTECQRIWTRSVERGVRNYLKLLSAVWLSLCGLSWNSQLTFYLLTWRIWWAPNKASKGLMGFNSVFKGSITLWILVEIFGTEFCPGRLENVENIGKYLYSP